jgi:class 3 adenylate cyclase
LLNRLIAWFWRHHRLRYFPAVGVVAGVTLWFGIALPIGVVFGLAFGYGPGFWPFLAAIAVACVVGPAAGIGTHVTMRRVANAYTRGDDDADPRAAREIFLTAPSRMSLRGLFILIPFGLLVVGPLAARSSHVRRYSVVSIDLLVLWAFGVAAFVIGTAIRLINRPILEELDAALGDNAPRPIGRSWSLQLRLFVASVGVAGATGIAAGGLAGNHAHSRDAIAAIIVAASIVVGGYAVALVTWGLVRPSLEPLRALAEGISRVREGDLTRRVPIIATDELGEVVMAFNEMLIGLRQREALHNAFGSYVDPSLTQRLLTQDSSIFDGEAVEATIFFADVRGFTHYAESVEPEEAVAQLNRLFEILVPAIRDNGGHPNRYTGDGVIAVFGTPEPLLDHADCALRAALVIQREILQRFGNGLRLGIGINTGKVIAGTIGAAGKLDFTVIGDAVNVAARVEELTKETGDRILLTGRTLDALAVRPERLSSRGTHELRGRDGLVELFAVAH